MTRQMKILLLCSILTLMFSGAILAAEESPDYFSRETWEMIWQSDDVTHLPVVFVHGIAGWTEQWEKTMQVINGKNTFHMRYYHDDKIYHNYYGDVPDNWVWSVSYYTVNPFEESLNGDLTLYAERLRTMINLIKKMTGEEQVILIAHSMGGLVARKYMTLDPDCWNSVYRILTVGSPNDGVATSIGIVGQLEDLRRDSPFVTKLQAEWALYAKSKKWGVVGAIDTRLFFNNFHNDPNATDSAGPGFIAVSSAIPGEWSEAMKTFKQPVYNTPGYGFRLAVDSSHMGLLYHEGTFRGIHWAMQND